MTPPSQKPKDNLVWLQINDHVKSSVVIAGPFHHSATGAQCLWDTLKKPYKEHSIIPKTLPLDHPLYPYGLIMSEIFLREDHKDEEKDGVLKFTITWKHESNRPIVDTIEAAKRKIVNMFTVREVSMAPIKDVVPNGDDNSHVKPLAVSGGQYVSLGEEITTFLDKRQAIDKAKQLLTTGRYGKSIIKDLTVLDFGVHRDGPGLIYGVSADENGALGGLVTVTEVVVWEFTRSHPTLPKP
jgi:hypothetical protein